MTEVPKQNPQIECRVECDKYVIKTTMWVELDHLCRPWRIPVMVPHTAGGES